MRLEEGGIIIDGGGGGGGDRTRARRHDVDDAVEPMRPAPPLPPPRTTEHSVRAHTSGHLRRGVDVRTYVRT